MCFPSAPSMPTPPAPAAPVAPPQVSTLDPSAAAQAQQTLPQSQQGLNALRIDRTTQPVSGGGGVGLNIPQ